MTSLADFGRVALADRGLCVIITSRRDSTAHASVVSAGIVGHPLTGQPVVGLVAIGNAHKLANLQRTPRATLVAKAGFEWVAVEGPTVIIGPDDSHPSVGPDELRLLLRTVFTAAGGTHDDWDEYDRVMLSERRAGVFVEPERVYSNR